MRRLIFILCALFCVWTVSHAESETVYSLYSDSGELLTQICGTVDVGDAYIASDNRSYEVIRVDGNQAVARHTGDAELPPVDWLNAEDAVQVSAITRQIAIYCTHSDECYEPSDGAYSTTERGSIYQVASALAESLMAEGVEAVVSDALHHPHDAGAYRRSRQTAVQLLKDGAADCLIDVHRDGIPDPASYAVTIGGEEVSKIRLLVGRGNQNAALNKEFALLIKAVADHVYPGLVKDIYMGKGAFNQDLLPRSILFECGTYTLEKERVLRSMPMIADVLDRALYGGVVGSAGRITSDAGSRVSEQDVVTGEPDPVIASDDSKGTVSGLWFILALLIVGVAGFALLSSGSLKGGARKAARNLNEMTGGLIGKKPGRNEDPEHS